MKEQFVLTSSKLITNILGIDNNVLHQTSNPLHPNNIYFDKSKIDKYYDQTQKYECYNKNHLNTRPNINQYIRKLPKHLELPTSMDLYRVSFDEEKPNVYTWDKTKSEFINCNNRSDYSAIIYIGETSQGEQYVADMSYPESGSMIPYFKKIKKTEPITTYMITRDSQKGFKYIDNIHIIRDAQLKKIRRITPHSVNMNFIQSINIYQ